MALILFVVNVLQQSLCGWDGFSAVWRYCSGTHGELQEAADDVDENGSKLDPVCGFLLLCRRWDRACSRGELSP